MCTCLQTFKQAAHILLPPASLARVRPPSVRSCLPGPPCPAGPAPSHLAILPGMVVLIHHIAADLARGAGRGVSIKPRQAGGAAVGGVVQAACVGRQGGWVSPQSRQPAAAMAGPFGMAGPRQIENTTLPGVMLSILVSPLQQRPVPLLTRCRPRGMPGLEPSRPGWPPPKAAAGRHLCTRQAGRNGSCCRAHHNRRQLAHGRAQREGKSACI